MALPVLPADPNRRKLVVEDGREARANVIRRIGQVGGDGQVLLGPQILNIGVELLADIHIAGLQSGCTGSIILCRSRAPGTWEWAACRTWKAS